MEVRLQLLTIKIKFKNYIKILKYQINLELRQNIYFK